MSSHDPSSSVQVRPWQQAFEAALQEADPKTLFKRIEVAEAAILTRREILLSGADGFAEREEIEAALAKLGALKKEVLDFS